MKLDTRKVEVKMAEKKLTMRELARRYGASNSRIWAMMNSKNITPACVGRIAEALEAQVTEILADE